MNCKEDRKRFLPQRHLRLRQKSCLGVCLGQVGCSRTRPLLQWQTVTGIKLKRISCLIYYYNNYQSIQFEIKWVLTTKGNFPRTGQSNQSITNPLAKRQSTFKGNKWQKTRGPLEAPTNLKVCFARSIRKKTTSSILTTKPNPLFFLTRESTTPTLSPALRKSAEMMTNTLRATMC